MFVLVNEAIVGVDSFVVYLLFYVGFVEETYYFSGVKFGGFFVEAAVFALADQLGKSTVRTDVSDLVKTHIVIVWLPLRALLRVATVINKNLLQLQCMWKANELLCHQLILQKLVLKLLL